MVQLYTPRGSYDSSDVTRFKTATEEAIARDLNMLGEPESPGHLRVFYVRSRDEMKVITGGRSSGYADAPALGVVLVAAPAYRPATRHEIMHIFSLRLWGHAGANGGGSADPSLDVWRAGSWLREGIAAAAEDLCGDYTYRGVSAQMQVEGQLLSLDTLREASCNKTISPRTSRRDLWCGISWRHTAASAFDSCGVAQGAISRTSVARAHHRSKRRGMTGFDPQRT